MLIYEWFHYSLSPSLFVAFTYKEAPAFFGTVFSFFLLFSFLGLSLCHLPNNLSNYNVLTENAPFFYKISGIWSNHEGSILSWCRILSFYKLLLFFRNLSKRQNVSRRRIHIEVFFLCLELRKEFHSIFPSLRKKGKGFTQYFSPFVLKRSLDYEPRGKSTFDRSDIFYSPLNPEIRKEIRKQPMGSIGCPGFLEQKKTYPLLHLSRNKKERVLYIDEQRIKGVLGIALFFYLFLSASSDPFVRTFFVRTEQLAESNPVPQDPISAIHPPCIYAGNVASVIGFGLCRSKMMNGIVALHSPKIRKDAEKKNGTLLCSARCVGSRITSDFFLLKFKDVSCYPVLLLRRKRSPLMLLGPQFFTRFLLWAGALVSTGREQTKCILHNEKKENINLPLCFSCTGGANTVVSDQEQDAIRIWILTCWYFLTVGILPGSWWAYHELGWGGWWFWDPVENASFMPWVLATARIHSVILPLLHSWTSFLNLIIFICCVLGTFSIRSGLLASVHSFVTADDTRKILCWWFFFKITAISMILFFQMKQQASVCRTYKKEMVLARSTLVHLARAQSH